MIEFRSLNNSFGNPINLKQLSLSVDHGDVFCMPGKYGGDKTTMINFFNSAYKTSKLQAG